MAKIEFSNRIVRPGSTMREWQVSRNGRPHGAIWTWPNTDDEWHPYHAKANGKDHRTFPTLDGAKAYLTA